MSFNEILVVGIDGEIGSAVFSDLQASGINVMGTSRRRVHQRTNCISLDLANSGLFKSISGSYSTAILCAGITNIAACEANPRLTHEVNVTGTLTLAKSLVEKGTKVIFLSSNAVFDGENSRPDEYAIPNPPTEYGRQKVKVEEGLLHLLDRHHKIAIIRLSKTLPRDTGLAADFMRKITNGEGCNAFVDLRMSPTSLIYAISAIQKVATGDQLGIFHLSGESEQTYAEFARLLAKHMGADESVVRSCKSSDYGVKLLYQPARPALGMTRTCQTLKIAPEPMEQLLNYLTGKRSQL